MAYSIVNRLSVVVPVYNEACNLQPLIEEICAALSQETYEIIYVNDGSVDDTPRHLRELRAQFPNLRVIHHNRRYGQSAAIRTGVKAANGNWIATLDGDGQNNPADIPRLLAQLGDGVDMVCGNRRQSRCDSWIKRLSSIVANGVRSRFLHDHTPDTGCGIKLFRRDLFLELPYFDHMHRFLPALVLRQGGNVLSIPVSHRPRKHGTSNYGTLDRLITGIVDLLGVMWLQRRIKHPLFSEE